MTFSIVIVVSRGLEGQSRRETFLKCFEALLNQDYPKNLYEIVVVDNGTGFEAQDWESLSSRARELDVGFTLLSPQSDPGSGLRGNNKKTVSNPKSDFRDGNIGPARGRNSGWQAVYKGETKIKSEAIAFTDDDVLVPSNWLKSFSESFEKFPGVSGVGGACFPPAEVSKSNLFAAYDELIYDRYFPKDKRDVIYSSYQRDEHPVFTGSIAYKREVLEEVNGFDESFEPLVYGEDGDLKERVLEKGHFLVHVPVVCTHLGLYSFRRFVRQQMARGAGIVKFRLKHGKRRQTGPEIILRIILLPLVFVLFLRRTGFNLKFSFLEGSAYFFRQIGKINYNRRKILSTLDDGTGGIQKKTKILFGDHAPILGGAQLALKRHLESLNRERFEPTLVISRHLPEINNLFRPIKDLKIIDFDFPKLKTTSPLLLIQLIISGLRFLRLVALVKPDLLVANTERAFYFCFWASLVLRKDLILIIRDFEYSKKLLRLTDFKVNHFVCVSKAIKDYYCLSSSKASVIYVGSDLLERLNKISPEAAADLKKTFTPNPKTLVIGFVGRLEVWKGVYLLLETFAKIVNSVSPEPSADLGWKDPIKLVFVGDGFEREGLEKEAKNLGVYRHVFFTDLVSDVETWYKTFDIFVHASTEPEPFATTVIEAAFSHLSIIATNTGGTGEFIENNFNGLLVMPNVDQLKEAIFRLIKDGDLRKSLGENAYRKVVSGFSEEEITAKLEEVYSKRAKTTGVSPWMKR